MKEINFNQFKGKEYHILVMCSNLLEYVTQTMKKNNNFYKLKNKQILNTLIKANEKEALEYKRIREQLLESEEGIKAYQDVAKDKSIDLEVIADDLSLAQTILFLFVNVFYKSSDSEFVELYKNLNSINKGERLMNKKEQELFAKKLLKKYCNYELNPDQLQKFINEIS